MCLADVFFQSAFVLVPVEIWNRKKRTGKNSFLKAACSMCLRCLQIRSLILAIKEKPSGFWWVEKFHNFDTFHRPYPKKTIKPRILFWTKDGETKKYRTFPLQYSSYSTNLSKKNSVKMAIWNCMMMWFHRNSFFILKTVVKKKSSNCMMMWFDWKLSNCICMIL